MGGPQHAVIVGASVGGISAAEALRSEGFIGAITVVGAEQQPPYLRPPLSKQVLTEGWGIERVSMLSQDAIRDLDVELRLGAAATALDLRRKRVHLGQDHLSYDSLIIATGVVARRLPTMGDLAGVHGLRTIEDASALRAHLERSQSMVVVGSGVLGAEISSAARALGLDVVLIGRNPRLSFGQVGDALAEPLYRLHRDNGVDVRLGARVDRARGDDRVEAVVLGDGTSIETNLVVVAVGGDPATGWLQGSGLDLRDGVLCDASGLAGPDVYAVGDVAGWALPDGGVSRTEHQLNAIEQAQAVAHRIVTGETSPPIVPFFWSELHGTKIQAYGRFPADSPMDVVVGSPESGRFVLAARRGDRIAGVLAWNMPRDFRAARGSVDAETRTNEGGTS